MNLKVLTIAGIVLGAIAMQAVQAQEEGTPTGSCEAQLGPASVVVVPGAEVAVAGTATTDTAAAPSEPVASASTPEAAAPTAETAAPAEVAVLMPAIEAAPVEKPKPAHNPAPPPPKEPLTAWWPPKNPEALNILYAGEASFTKAITILSDGSFDSAESANRNIKVTQRDGSAVHAEWQVAKANDKMLLLSVPPGVYNVAISEGFKDASGKAVSTASKGQVYIR